MRRKQKADRKRRRGGFVCGVALGAAAWLLVSSPLGKRLYARLAELLCGGRRGADEELERKIEETRERLRAGEVLGPEGVGDGA